MGRDTLARNAVELLLPALGRSDGDATSQSREPARGIGNALLALLRSRLDGEGQRALDQLAADPSAPDRKHDLKRRIAILIDADPNRIDLHALILEGQRIAEQDRQGQQMPSFDEGGQGQQGIEPDEGQNFANCSPHGSGGGRDD